MDFDALLEQRRSIRDFSSRPVPNEVINTVLEQALKAPSSSNTQPYRIAVATGSLRNTLQEQFCSRFDTASKIQRMPFIKKLWFGLTSGVLPDGDFKTDTNYPAELKKRAVECGMGLYGTLGIARSDFAARQHQMKRNFEFFNAPVVMFLFVHGQRGVYSALDAGIFLQNLMLAASANGLGTCAQAALATWSGPVKQHFDIDPDYKMICGLSLGYPTDHKVNQFRPPKRTIEELCFAPSGE